MSISPAHARDMTLRARQKEYEETADKIIKQINKKLMENYIGGVFNFTVSFDDLMRNHKAYWKPGVGKVIRQHFSDHWTVSIDEEYKNKVIITLIPKENLS